LAAARRLKGTNPDIAHNDRFAGDPARKGHREEHHQQGRVAAAPDAGIEFLDYAAAAKEEQVTVPQIGEQPAALGGRVENLSIKAGVELRAGVGRIV
jgi:hypothetical protein